MDIVIRKYEDSDYLQVQKILAENFSVSKIRDSFDPSSYEFVAVDGYEVIGYFILHLMVDVVCQNKWFLVEYVCVQKDKQGMGIGTKMMEFAISYARENHICYLELTSGYQRSCAHRLYEKLGFQRRESYLYRKVL